MKRTLASLSLSALVLGGAVATAPTASADERVCRGTLYGITVEDVKVPQGATCILRGTIVEGNITVNRDATLQAFNVTVDGNTQSQGHKRVEVRGSTVDGNIQLEQGGAVVLRNNRVNGDIQLFSNSYGKKVVRDNRVGGNLQCKSNTPAPIGGGNRVAGDKEGQCRSL